MKIYYFLLMIYIIINALKYYLSMKYYKVNRKTFKELEGLIEDLEEKVSIVQPILSGDRNLKNSLTKNLININYANFIWLVDKDDKEGIEITNEIISENQHAANRVKIVYVDKIPEDVNPKVYKLNRAVPFLKKYCIILDDDTTLEGESLKEIFYKLQESEALITGLPIYTNNISDYEIDKKNKSSKFFSNLVEAFVNSNSFLLYLGMAAISDVNTINGMFYACRTETIERLDPFENIKYELCDDYAMAKFIRKNDIPIIQSTVKCEVYVDIKDKDHYINLMKRWMVFANQYIKENLSVPLFFLLILPTLLPLILLIFSITLSFYYKEAIYLILFIVIHIFKTISIINLRNKAYNLSFNKKDIIYEILADYLQILHYIHSLFSPRVIRWRNKEVSIGSDKIKFSKK